MLNFIEVDYKKISFITSEIIKEKLKKKIESTCKFLEST